MIWWREAATHMPRFMRPSFATPGCVASVACNLYWGWGTGAGTGSDMGMWADQPTDSRWSRCDQPLRPSTLSASLSPRRQHVRCTDKRRNLDRGLGMRNNRTVCSEAIRWHRTPLANGSCNCDLLTDPCTITATLGLFPCLMLFKSRMSITHSPLSTLPKRGVWLIN